MSFDGPVSDCDVYAVGKSHQLVHPKTTDHKVKLSIQLVFADLMGFLTPEALRGYKYITKISDEHTKWTETYLLNSKRNALTSFQVFVQSVLIPSGFRTEHLRVDKGGEFVRKEFQGCCPQTGVSLEYASTNTSQQIGTSERFERILAAMVRCMLADSGLPKFLWAEMMFTAAFLGNRAPHSAIGMQSPYNCLLYTSPSPRDKRQSRMPSSA